MPYGMIRSMVKGFIQMLCLSIDARIKNAQNNAAGRYIWKPR